MSSKHLGINGTLSIGYGAIIIYFSVPRSGGSALRPIRPIRVTQISGMQPTKSEIESELQWLLSNIGEKWNEVYSEENCGNHDLNQAFGELGKQRGIRMTPRSIELRMASVIVSIQESEFSVSLGCREAGGWIYKILDTVTMKHAIGEKPIPVGQVSRRLVKIITAAIGDVPESGKGQKAGLKTISEYRKQKRTTN